MLQYRAQPAQLLLIGILAFLMILYLSWFGKMTEEDPAPPAGDEWKRLHLE